MMTTHEKQSLDSILSNPLRPDFRVSGIITLKEQCRSFLLTDFFNETPVSLKEIQDLVNQFDADYPLVTYGDLSTVVHQMYQSPDFEASAKRCMDLMAGMFHIWYDKAPKSS